ncbi:MAG TPA: hypothetical protein VGH28_27530 [Polyangiaceae bacterium]|jgi:hypothetical protein
MNEAYEADRNGTTQKRARVRTLDDLARLSSRELGAIYEGGTVPELSALDGDLVGRMLAVRKIEKALASFSGSARFPWAGKSFRAESARRGTGINRVKLGGRHRLFPFETFVGASVLDGRPALVLDYDLSDNPAAIRAIHDEVREVAPKIFLGPACVKRAGKTPVLVLWFALDASHV